MKTIAKRSAENLPINYVDAKSALAACVRVDECKSWADKAQALKSYAKQMKDTTLEDLAQRIRDRAIRRGGELLAKLQAAQGGNRGGGRPSKDGNQRGGKSPLVSRKSAALAAGLSPDQAKQMLRVANVPEAQFESMVEASRPATVTQLAELGRKKREKIKPPEFADEYTEWTHAVAHLAAVPACGLEVLGTYDPLFNSDDLDNCRKAIANLKEWERILRHVKA